MSDGTILRIDSSMRDEGSVSRRLTDRIVERLTAEIPGARVITRDLADGVPYVDPGYIAAKGGDEQARDPETNPTYALSLALIEELRAADRIVIGLPVYNFTAPAVFKAWVDLVAMPGETFRYTADGQVGLLADRPVHVAVASGGTALGSEIDYLTPWLRHILGFMGLEDLRIVAADKLVAEGEEAVAEAERQIDRLAA